MANVSSAAGTATITARNRAEALQVLKALDDRFSVYDYYTSYNYDVLDTVSETDDEFQGSCSFDAAGRWSFSGNLEGMGRWCEHDPLLTALGWSITFDFVDEEEGCDFLYHAVTRVSHKAGENLDDMKPEEIAYTDYDRNVYTMSQMCGADNAYLEETFYLGENYAEDDRWEDDGEEYDDHRIECLEAAVRSYLAENLGATRGEAERYILEKFPFLAPIEKEK